MKCGGSGTSIEMENGKKLLLQASEQEYELPVHVLQSSQIKRS
jgi:hypothetical protein